MTTVTFSPRLVAILLPDTLLTGLYATKATSGTTPVSVGLIAQPHVTGPSNTDVEDVASTANDSAESTPGVIIDALHELVTETDSIDQFWQSLATSLEPALLA